MYLSESNPSNQDKAKLLKAEAELIESLRTDWVPFAITVVFKSSGCQPRAEHWLDEYKHKVVWKVNKRLSRRAHDLILIHDLACYYEFGVSSLMKTNADKRRPHHIHATLLVPKIRVDRVWDSVENKLTERLHKDFHSIKTVSSVLMEPIRDLESINWLMYSAKGKPFNGC